MIKEKVKTVCILPELKGVGGPAVFQKRLMYGLDKRGIKVVHDPGDPSCSSVLINGGTRKIKELRQAHRRGVRIVQRLNGLNWIHKKRFNSIKFYLRSEWNNRLLAFLRKNITDEIIYQSQFSKEWWERVFGEVRANNQVIYNGVNLDQYTPEGAHSRPDDRVRVLVVEGKLASNNVLGLINAAHLVRLLAKKVNTLVELMVVGSVLDDLKATIQNSAGTRIHWKGTLSTDQVPVIDRSAHVLFSADINAACPNSVIEAMACGLPVVSFDTGALDEMVTGDAGIVVPYGADYWNLEPPVVEPLASAALEVISDQNRFRSAARKRAVEHFDINKVVDQYLDVLISS